jgi:hypothetical protein
MTMGEEVARWIDGLPDDKRYRAFWMVYHLVFLARDLQPGQVDSVSTEELLALAEGFMDPSNHRLLCDAVAALRDQRARAQALTLFVI